MITKATKVITSSSEKYVQRVLVAKKELKEHQCEDNVTYLNIFPTSP